MELPRHLTEEELSTINRFERFALEQAIQKGIDDKDWNIVSISQEAGIDVWEYPKEGVMIQAIWVSFLSVMRRYTPQSELKYPTIKDFQDAYKDNFNSYPIEEIKVLWETANWMSKLFTFIPARKNKGLAIAVIPKLIQGWFAKYVTGSGQTKATADRVKIFETEGDIKPHPRGKAKFKKQLSTRMSTYQHHSMYHHEESTGHSKRQKKSTTVAKFSCSNEKKSIIFTKPKKLSHLFSVSSLVPNVAFNIGHTNTKQHDGGCTDEEADSIEDSNTHLKSQDEDSVTSSPQCDSPSYINAELAVNKKQFDDDPDFLEMLRLLRSSSTASNANIGATEIPSLFRGISNSGDYNFPSLLRGLSTCSLDGVGAISPKGNFFHPLTVALGAKTSTITDASDPPYSLRRPKRTRGISSEFSQQQPGQEHINEEESLTEFLSYSVDAFDDLFDSCLKATYPSCTEVKSLAGPSPRDCSFDWMVAQVTSREAVGAQEQQRMMSSAA